MRPLACDLLYDERALFLRFVGKHRTPYKVPYSINMGLCGL